MQTYTNTLDFVRGTSARAKKLAKVAGKGQQVASERVLRLLRCPIRRVSCKSNPPIDQVGAAIKSSESVCN